MGQSEVALVVDPPFRRAEVQFDRTGLHGREVLPDRRGGSVGSVNLRGFRLSNMQDLEDRLDVLRRAVG